MNKKLLPYGILFLGVILLAIDIPISVLAYPTFEPFHTEAPLTVDLLINHVIGHWLRLDVLSDVLGYALLAVSCVMLGPGNRQFFKLLPWIVAGIVFYLCFHLMPFSLNGGLRYRAGYLLYFVSGAIQILVQLRAMLRVCDNLETTESHGYNNLSTILMIISCFAGTISMVVWFYDLFKLSMVYLGVQLIFLGIFWYRVWRGRQILLDKTAVPSTK